MMVIRSSPQNTTQWSQMAEVGDTTGHWKNDKEDVNIAEMQTGTGYVISNDQQGRKSCQWSTLLHSLTDVDS